ncbi:hypothetical protein JAAARDRAFT_198799 [Jaapia argillacea MUCL 33604]|uniref:Uncharacterized protein n=1 Tax=Jaapia argillacea MUCL 33604 TaxID=933084 RepID=A0A067PAL2_9AGAM|nr:hypothetical protein JAAARDRAFT_198799 [Jaapia argillacea MUCL 33604]
MSRPEGEPNIYNKATGDFCLRAYLDEDYEVKVEEDESRGLTPELDEEILDPFYVPNAPSSTTPQSSPPVGPVPPPENNTIAPPASSLSRTCPALLPELPPSMDPAIPPHTTVLPVGDFDPLAYVTSIDDIIQPLADNIIKRFAGEAYHFPNLLVQYNQIHRQIFRQTDFGVDVDFDSTLDDLFELADDFEDGLGDGLGASMGDHNDPSAIIIDDTQAASMVLQSTSSGMASSPPVTVSPAGSPLASATPLTASSTKLPVAEPDLMTMMSAVDGFSFGSLLSLPVVPKPTTAFETLVRRPLLTQVQNTPLFLPPPSSSPAPQPPSSQSHHQFLLQLKKVSKTHMPSTSQTINHTSNTTSSPPPASNPTSTPPTIPNLASTPPTTPKPCIHSTHHTQPRILSHCSFASYNVPTSSMSGSTADVAVNLSDMDLWPKWLQEGYPAMMGLHLGDQWQSCVALFVEFERCFNFSNPKGVSLKSTSIPLVIQQWKKNY